MGGLFSTPHTSSSPPPAPLPQAPQPEIIDYQAQADAKAAADAQRKAARVAAGRQSTILTGGMGDDSLTTVSRATLLGGAK